MALYYCRWYNCSGVRDGRARLLLHVKLSKQYQAYNQTGKSQVALCFPLTLFCPANPVSVRESLGDLINNGSTVLPPSPSHHMYYYFQEGFLEAL